MSTRPSTSSLSSARQRSTQKESLSVNASLLPAAWQMSAAFWQAALLANPGVMDDIAQGEFAALHGWLRDNLYRYGRKFTADELIERVTGAPLTIDPYIAYLRDKFGELYGINGS